MFIDHINDIWLHQSQPLMMFIGRGTFPLFCYAVAMAVLKIKESSLPQEEKKKKIRTYLTRLLILAVVTQPFYFFALDNGLVNVIFTLAVGMVFAVLSFRLRLWQMHALFVIALLSMLWIIPVEFWLAGIMLPAAIILVMQGHRSAWPFLILLLLLLNCGGILPALQRGDALITWVAPALNGLFCIFVPWVVLDVASRLPQTGRFLPKYALYVFYPVHMTIIKLLALVFFK
jgi:hypothetical protein